ncbi:hypothetical protein Q9233_017668, partial [Columba guinea]
CVCWGGGARRGGGASSVLTPPPPPPIQFIVGEDGTCGVVYDPAVIDGAVVAEMVDHALDFCRRPDPGPAPLAPPIPSPQRLRFSIGPETTNELVRAKRHLDRCCRGRGRSATCRACGWRRSRGGDPLPRLFLDPAYVTATHFRLCSMQ